MFVCFNMQGKWEVIDNEANVLAGPFNTAQEARDKLVELEKQAA